MDAATIRARLALSMFIVLALAACSSTIESPHTQPQASSAAPSPSLRSASPTAVDASPTATSTSIVLPSPGETCTAAQLAVGSGLLVGEPATIDTVHVLVIQPVHNTGRTCNLELPRVIGLASGSGPLMAVEVPNLGITVCKSGSCRDEYPTSFKIEAGKRFELRLNAWWWSPTLGAPSHPPCDHPIPDVTRGAFPVSDGTIDMAWGASSLTDVRISPPTMALGVDLKPVDQGATDAVFFRQPPRLEATSPSAAAS
jgi:hypothetical protein